MLTIMWKVVYYTCIWPVLFLLKSLCIIVCKGNFATCTSTFNTHKDAVFRGNAELLK